MHLKQNALYSNFPDSTCRIARTLTVYARAQTAILLLFQSNWLFAYCCAYHSAFLPHQNYSIFTEGEKILDLIKGFVNSYEEYHLTLLRYNDTICMLMLLFLCSAASISSLRAVVGVLAFPLPG